MYQLYASCGFSEGEIALLFLTGFLSSSTFGTFTGSMADKYGRRRMALAFCATYSVTCAIKFSTSFWVLFAGRVLGGISTSLLFSVFESWYVKRHREGDLDPAWMSDTFSASTFANGMLAIVAGVVANVSAETVGLGPRAPFAVAIASFIVCFAVIASTWEENYGEKETGLVGNYKEGLMLILGDARVLALGLVQVCMYLLYVCT